MEENKESKNSPEAQGPVSSDAREKDFNGATQQSGTSSAGASGDSAAAGSNNSSSHSDQRTSSTLEGLDLNKLSGFLQKWATRVLPEQKPPQEVPPAPDSGFSIALFLLKLLPWLTGASFLLSLFWDFSGTVTLPFRDHTLELKGLLRMLTVSGLIGFGTNWVAIKMLFHPRHKRPLLGQGLIPSRKERIALKLGESISREIINPELILEQIRESGLITHHRENLTRTIREVINQPEFVNDVIDMAEHYIQGFIRSDEFKKNIKQFVKGIDFDDVGGLESGVLKLYRIFSGDKDVSERLEELVDSMTFTMDHYEDQLGEYLQHLPDMMEKRGDVLEEAVLNGVLFLVEQINVQEIITDNLRKLDEIRLERLLLNSTSDQLQYIQYLGCFLGILGGFLIWEPLVTFLILGSIVGFIFGLDYLLHRMTRK
ncbi:MAG: hypothetical protein CMF59_15350 [Leptospiraceae bacterium]|nr:hypothetical protein [Leptospiraceae bacterium]